MILNYLGYRPIQRPTELQISGKADDRDDRVVLDVVFRASSSYASKRPENIPHPFRFTSEAVSLGHAPNAIQVDAKLNCATKPIDDQSMDFRST